MAVSAFYLYPASNYDAYNRYSQDYQNVDDPQPVSAHDGVSSYDYLYGFSGSAQASGITYGLTAPPSGYTINKIRVYGAFFISNAGADAFATDPEVIACVRPAGSSTYYTAAATVAGGTGAVTGTGRVNGLGFYNRNTASWTGSESPAQVYWEWATNPVTGVAWTLSDLQNLKVGWFCDDGKGTPYAGAKVPVSSSSSYVACSQLFVWVEATTVAASIEAERFKGSHFLRMFRRPVRKVSVVVPPKYADLDVGDTFVMDHPLGPTPDAGGWGKKDWQRRELIVIGTTILPTQRAVRLEAIDAREFRCGIWSPLVTDLGFSEDGNGIPILHHGSGFEFDDSADYRDATHYVKKQENDPTYAAAGAGKGLWTPSGLWLGFAAATNAMTYSTFSGGSGSTFTGWTKATTGGGTHAEDTTNFLIDASGYRRGCLLSCPTSGTSYVYQLSGTIGGAGHYGRVRVHYNRLAGWSAGTGNLYVWLTRTSDGYSWNNITKAWQSSATWAILDTTNGTTGLQRWVSEQIDMSVSTTYTLNVGLFTASTGTQVVLNEASLFVGSSQNNAEGLCAADEPILPTAASALASEADYTSIACATGDEVREDRGTMFLRWTPSFNHADMADGDVKLIWTYRRNLGLEYMRAYYVRVSSSAAQVVFQRVYMGGTLGLVRTSESATVALATTGDPTVAARGRTMALAFRWTSASDELDLGTRQMKAYVIPDASAGSESTAGALKTGTLSGYHDFTSKGITISDASGGSGAYANAWTKTAADGWTNAGWSTLTANQRITAAGGGVAFMPVSSRTRRDIRFMVGLSNTDPDVSYTSIDFALFFEQTAAGNYRWAVYENNVNVAVAAGNSWSTDYAYGGYFGRIQVESGNVVKYYLENTLIYTSANAPTYPLYVDASFYDQTDAAVWGVSLYGDNVAGTFDQASCVPPRLEFPTMPSISPLGLVSQCGGGAVRDFEVVPYVLTDEEVERRMRGREE